MLLRVRHWLQHLGARRRAPRAVASVTWEQTVARERLIDDYLDPRITLIPPHLRTTLRAATAGLQNAPFTRDKILEAIAGHGARLRSAIDRGGATLTPAERRYFDELDELSAAVRSGFPDR